MRDKNWVRFGESKPNLIEICRAVCASRDDDIMDLDGLFSVCNACRTDRAYVSNKLLKKSSASPNQSSIQGSCRDMPPKNIV